MKTRNTQGFSLVEILVTTTIIALMMAGGYAALMSGQSSWFTSEAGIQIQENLRQALDQITQELRQSKYDQVAITQDAGINNSDSIKFSIPVICHVGDTILDSNGDVAHWGATTRWGCRDAACMDADDDCSTVEYKSIQYAIKTGDLLVRRLLNDLDVVVKEDIVAHNIKDFQMSLPNSTSPLTLTVNAGVSSVLNRALSVSVQSVVDFRNK